MKQKQVKGRTRKDKKTHMDIQKKYKRDTRKYQDTQGIIRTDE